MDEYDPLANLHGQNAERLNSSPGFKKEIKWMVFKLKQKAETDYFQKLSIDKLPLGHRARNREAVHDILQYGYNWPYDYFSLVELVKLDVTKLHRPPPRGEDPTERDSPNMVDLVPAGEGGVRQ